MKEHECDICGRKLRSKIKSHGYVLCPKHYSQLKKYGKFLDKNPRTIFDPNRIIYIGKIYGKDVSAMELYDKDCNVTGYTIFDTEDTFKVQHMKWNIGANGYVQNRSRINGKAVNHFHRVILRTNQFVDHINHNILDNRKSNLRIVTKSQNQMNANYKGVSKTQDGRFYAHIKINQKMINLGKYVEEEEAYWARWYAETILFKDYRFPKPEPFILSSRKKEIREYVDKKVQRV